LAPDQAVVLCLQNDSVTNCIRRGDVCGLPVWPMYAVGREGTWVRGCAVSGGWEPPDAVSCLLLALAS
jgi:hypothetical protein